MDRDRLRTRLREETQPWVTCLFTDILLSYLEEAYGADKRIDYPALFKGLEGFEVPQDPPSFLRDVTNWVPLAVLRELLIQCEALTGKLEMPYDAARAYFEPGKRHLPSLHEIIVRVLNDVRSVFICASLWGSVQTNYLKLQSFERGSAKPELYMLAQFDEKARPTLEAIYLLRGIAEGFPRLYPFIAEVQCVEEISQLRIQDIVREFPDFNMRVDGPHLLVQHRHSQEPALQAVRTPLGSETISLSQEFLTRVPSAVLTPRNGKIQVLTAEEPSADAGGREAAPWAYKIVKGGTLAHGTLACTLREGGIYNAPYSRFRFVWQEKTSAQKPTSVENVRRGISDLLFNHLHQIKEDQMRTVQYHIEKRRLTLENIYLRKEIEREYAFGGIVGKSPKMEELFSILRSIAETDVTVLIQGETGTGKELIARAIHYNSPRKQERFVAINCGALSETLLESELFGHEKGAFTGAATQRKGIFEVADGGTLFLDEIGETTASTQIKLLRVLQENEIQRVGSTDVLKVDVRIIAATNQNLEERVKKGQFRQDLFYRLNVFPVWVPRLRERKEDIPLLVDHFIEKSKEKLKKKAGGVASQAMAFFMAHDWPGNVRELENTIQRMMIVAKSTILDVVDLPPEIRGTETEAKPEPKDLKEIARGSAEVFERKAILDALSQTLGNITRAAKILGISRATLQNKMKAYRLRDAKN